MWMRELEVLGFDPPQGLSISEEDLEGYLGNNTANLLGLEPTKPPETWDEAVATLSEGARARLPVPTVV
jgi:hypothetical protein